MNKNSNVLKRPNKPTDYFSHLNDVMPYFENHKSHPTDKVTCTQTSKSHAININQSLNSHKSFQEFNSRFRNQNRTISYNEGVKKKNLNVINFGFNLFRRNAILKIPKIIVPVDSC